MCKVLSENPAKLYGVFPQKGIIAPGSDADIVIYDPNIDFVISCDNQIGNAGYTPYEGYHTAGSIAGVYLRGKLVVDHGNVLEKSCGKFIARGLSRDPNE